MTQVMQHYEDSKNQGKCPVSERPEYTVLPTGQTA